MAPMSLKVLASMRVSTCIFTRHFTSFCVRKSVFNGVFVFESNSEVMMWSLLAVRICSVVPAVVTMEAVDLGFHPITFIHMKCCV